MMSYREHSIEDVKRDYSQRGALPQSSEVDRDLFDQTMLDPEQRLIIQARLHTLRAGDPVSDYWGFPEIQREIINQELEEAAISREKIGVGVLRLITTERVPREQERIAS
jgi:hypothetical protein